MKRSETSGWLRKNADRVRSEYRVCPKCGDRFPSPGALRLHWVRVCVGDAGVEVRRLGEAVGSQTALASTGIPEGYTPEQLLEIMGFRP